MRDFLFSIVGLGLALQATPVAGVASTGSAEANIYGYIIELEPGSSFNGLSARDGHAEFHRLARDVADYQVRHEFKDAEFFYGLSIDAKNSSDIAGLSNLPGVKAVYPNRLHRDPVPPKLSMAGTLHPGPPSPPTGLQPLSLMSGALATLRPL